MPNSFLYYSLIHSVQARTSYLPTEILWGHRFEQLVRFRNDTGEYLVDYSKFNNTFPVDMPTHSAKEFQEEAKHRELIRKQIHLYNDSEPNEWKKEEEKESSPTTLTITGSPTSLLTNINDNVNIVPSKRRMSYQFSPTSSSITRPNGPPPPPPQQKHEPSASPLLSESQRERIKFFSH